MTTTKKTLLIPGSVMVVAALALVYFGSIFYFTMASTVMTKSSPDGLHAAKLSRMQAIDVNFIVSIDGSRVYWSPDFAPVRADFREQLIWDTNSEAVVLEVAGRRIFGYHIIAKRQLTDAELSKIELTPFEELGFEGTLPAEPVTK
jgi:hypothetical protein